MKFFGRNVMAIKINLQNIQRAREAPLAHTKKLKIQGEGSRVFIIGLTFEERTL